MAEFIDPTILKGWWGSEEYQRLLSFEPENAGDYYRLPFAKYNELFPFIKVKIEHPAVMNPYLAIFLWRRYVKPNDVIIDPMAGIGGTPDM
ncbi:MAG: hypothetical protein QXN23_01625 [Candidatus Caldarchaeum sp.]|uniref:DNA methylase N-4/N-6 domain-containing protein n=1 Tax=Caldiarchaeum subterraneum TaxID=311458 RepID=A0A7C4E2S7_CALS0